MTAGSGECSGPSIKAVRAEIFVKPWSEDPQALPFQVWLIDAHGQRELFIECERLESALCLAALEIGKPLVISLSSGWVGNG